MYRMHTASLYLVTLLRAVKFSSDGTGGRLGATDACVPVLHCDELENRLTQQTTHRFQF